MPAKPNPKPVVEKWSARFWILNVGWDHVNHGSCDLPKCVSSKTFIDKGWVYRVGNKVMARTYLEHDAWLKEQAAKATQVVQEIINELDGTGGASQDANPNNL